MNQFIEFIQSQKEKWEKQGIWLKLGIEADFFPNGEEEPDTDNFVVGRLLFG